RDLHRRVVEAVGEGGPQRHVALVVVLVVLRRVLLLCEEEHGARVFDDGGRRDGRQRGIVEGGLEGGQVDERLEGAAGLALGRGRAVVLALRVVAPAHEGHDRARRGLQRDQRALHGRVVL